MTPLLFLVLFIILKANLVLCSDGLQLCQQLCLSEGDSLFCEFGCQQFYNIVRSLIIIHFMFTLLNIILAFIILPCRRQ